MLRLLFFLFIAVPLLELYLLIKVGAGIGGVPVILLCLTTAAMGGWLIRWQGFHTLMQAKERMARGDTPAEHVFHGIMLALAGVLLFTPGFVTDTTGFLLLVPALRRWLIYRYMIPTNQGTVIDITAEHVEQDSDKSP